MNALTPVSEVILTSGLAMFGKVSGLMIVLVGTILIMRIVSLQAKFAGPGEYGTVLTDTVLYFAMLSLFPFLITLIFSFSEALANKIYYIPITTAEGKLQEFLKFLFYKDDFLKVTGNLGGFFVIYLAQGLYSIFTGLLLSIAPIIIFMATILGFERGLSLLFTSIISISLWPVVWNLLGLLGNEIFKSIETSTIAVVVYWCLIHLLQLLSPLFCIVLINTLSPSGIVSRVASTGVSLGSKLRSKPMKRMRVKS